MKNMGKHRKFCAAVAVMTAVVLLWCGAAMANSDSGTWGSLTWTLNSSKLTISGSGDLIDATLSSGPAWRQNYNVGEVLFDTTNLTRIGDYVFYWTGWMNKSITLPSTVTEIGEGAFMKCLKLPSISIPNTVTSIGASAFSDCSDLKSITIPSGLTEISDFCFLSNTSLQSVTIPKNVTTIGEEAFCNCRSVEAFTFAGNPTVLGPGAFKDCNALTSFNVPKGVQKLDERLFCNDSNLLYVSIPVSVTEITSTAFFNCTKLEAIHYAGTSEQWNNITFGDNWDQDFPDDFSVAYGAASVYDVVFDSNGHGTAPNPQIIYGDREVYKPADLSAEGWIFTGWYKEAGCVNEWDFENDTVTENTTLYAGWVPYPKVTFDPNNHGTAPAPVTVEALGSTIAAPADPSEEGWIFTGWYKQADGDNLWDFSNDTVSGDTTLYAHWVKCPVVTFDANGHGTAPGSVTVTTLGSTIDRPQNPSADDWAFVGWYKEKACEHPWDFWNDTVSGDITLYAKWTDKCAVTLDDQFNEPVIEFLDFGTLYPYPKAPVDPKNEYKFTGWMIDEGGESVPKEWDPEQGNYEIKGNVVIFADWEPYWTEFCLDVVEELSGEHMTGGKVYFSEDVNRTDPLPYVDWQEIYAFDDPLTFVAVPDEGYGFLGWYEGEAVSDNPPRLEPKMDKLLTTSTSFTVTPTKGKDDSIGACAVFVKQYTITFTDASGKTLQTVKVNPGDVPKYTGATPTKAPDSQYAYTFAGWDPEIGAATGDTTYKAKFTARKIEEAKVYTVKVTVSGSKGGTAKASVKSGVSGTTVKLTATPAKGYWFKEWKVVSGGVSITSNKFKIGKADVEIQAVFKAQTNIAKAKVTVADQVYTGSKLKPAVTVKLSGVKLKKGTDYTVAYKKNTEIGKATVTIIGAGKYKGTVTANFKINPKPVKLSKLTPTKTELKV